MTLTDAFSLLIVEDDRQVSRSISRALGRVGYSVIAAPSFGTAQVLSCRFDVGVFDISLGDGDGVELAQAMLDDGRVDQVVFFTAERGSAVLDRARDLGVVIGKHEGTEALVAVLRGMSRAVAGPVSGIMLKGGIPFEHRRAVG